MPYTHCMPLQACGESKDGNLSVLTCNAIAGLGTASLRVC